jgi:hypothetical protein
LLPGQAVKGRFHTVPAGDELKEDFIGRRADFFHGSNPSKKYFIFRLDGQPASQSGRVLVVGARSAKMYL